MLELKKNTMKKKRIESCKMTEVGNKLRSRNKAGDKLKIE